MSTMTTKKPKPTMATNNNQAMNAIKAYLERRAAEDVQFAESYAKPGKSIDECYRYILGEARNMDKIINAAKSA
jgi:hypothetical protein